MYLKDKMNKKGLAPLVIFILIAVGLIIFGLVSGGLTAFKINDIFSSPILIIFIALLFLWLLSGDKKR